MVRATARMKAPARSSGGAAPKGLEDLTEEQLRHVERIEAGEDGAMDGEPVALRIKAPLEKVVPLRMSDAQWRVLAREADELGLRPTTLMRMWVLERLREAERGHTQTESGFAAHEASPS
jgi:hypothetical protein